MKSFKNTTFKDWIGFIVAVVLSVLFVVFSTTLYELFYYDASFANDMYNTGMYQIVAIIAIAIVWLVCALYYLIIDRWDRWYHWLIFMLIAVVIVPLVTYYYPDYYFINDPEYPMNYSYELFLFNIVSAAYTLVFYIVFSFCLKPLSTNCSATPF